MTNLSHEQFNDLWMQHNTQGGYRNIEGKLRYKYTCNTHGGEGVGREPRGAMEALHEDCTTKSGQAK